MLICFKKKKLRAKTKDMKTWFISQVCVCDMSLSSVYANRVKRKKKKKEVPFISVKFLFLVVLAGLHFKAQTLTKGVDISRAASYKVTFNFKMRIHTLNM